MKKEDCKTESQEEEDEILATAMEALREVESLGAGLMPSSSSLSSSSSSTLEVVAPSSSPSITFKSVFDTDAVWIARKMLCRFVLVLLKRRLTSGMRGIVGPPQTVSGTDGGDRETDESEGIERFLDEHVRPFERVGKGGFARFVLREYVGSKKNELTSL